jgi:hypothetical protein
VLFERDIKGGKNKPKNRRIISANIRGDVERLKELSQERLGS